MPSAFQLSFRGSAAVWRLERFGRKLRIGAAAYASEPLGLERCPGAKLLVALGADEGPDLVGPRVRSRRGRVDLRPRG